MIQLYGQAPGPVPVIVHYDVAAVLPVGPCHVHLGHEDIVRDLDVEEKEISCGATFTAVICLIYPRTMAVRNG